MFKKICPIIFFLLVLIFPNKVSAVLYINEFSSGTSDSDWVEIYNSDNTSLDLSSYVLRDSTSSNKIEPSGTIAGNGFATFNWSNRLNNDGDTIRLLLKSDESVVDKVIYGKEGDIQAPSGTQTAGRNPDGSSGWVFLSSSSKGESNNSASSVPTPTLTPFPSPTPVPTSKPTSIKSPTKTPATPIPTQKTLSSIPSVGQTVSTATSTKVNIPTSVLGQSTKSATAIPTPKANNQKKDVKILGQSNSKIPFTLMIFGIFLGICAIISFFIFKKRRTENETSE